MNVYKCSGCCNDNCPCCNNNRPCCNNGIIVNINVNSRSVEGLRFTEGEITTGETPDVTIRGQHPKYFLDVVLPNITGPIESMPIDNATD